MRVLHTIWSMGFGGIERVALDLGAALQDECGHEVPILAGQLGGEFASQFYEVFSDVNSLDLRSGWDVSKQPLAAAVDLMRNV